MAADGGDVPTVRSEIEAVGNGSPVNDFRRKRSWGISAYISQALRP
jgi:hypothetical protein